MKINSAILFVISFFFAAINSPRIATAQCTGQVTNLSGTSSVNGVNVTVTSAGFVNTLTYCGGITTPYWIGKDNISAGNGSYTFSFSPPVTGVTLNLSAVSNITAVGVEEIYLMVNGFHYPIAALGIVNSCEPMAVLTASGDVGGCVSCGGSGCSGINVPTTVSTITVADSVVSGDPNGTVFSIFICDSIETGIDNLNGDNHVLVFPNPLKANLNISTTETQPLELTVYDLVFNKRIQQKFTNAASINTEQLAKGIYFYEVRNKNGVIKKGKIVKD